jgi:hypothetical protein
MSKTITPEQQLKNVAKLVLTQATPNHRNNYKNSKAAIAGSAKQLAEMILDYLANELQPIDATSPF